MLLSPCLRVFKTLLTRATMLHSIPTRLAKISPKTEDGNIVTATISDLGGLPHKEVTPSSTPSSKSSPPLLMPKSIENGGVTLSHQPRTTQLSAMHHCFQSHGLICDVECTPVQCQNCKAVFGRDTTLMRRGPGGPRTLCNSCGLVWAKSGKMRDESKLAMVGRRAAKFLNERKRKADDLMTSSGEESVERISTRLHNTDTTSGKHLRSEERLHVPLDLKRMHNQGVEHGSDGDKDAALALSMLNTPPHAAMKCAKASVPTGPDRIIVQKISTVSAPPKVSKSPVPPHRGGGVKDADKQVAKRIIESLYQCSTPNECERVIDLLGRLDLPAGVQIALLKGLLEEQMTRQRQVNDLFRALLQRIF